MKKENSISRRSFLKSTAMAGALGAIGTGSASVLTSCAGGGESAAANKPLKEPGTYYIPELPDKATDGKELKAGVIVVADAVPVQQKTSWMLQTA